MPTHVKGRNSIEKVNERWEVSFIVFKENEKKVFKVTRRFPEFHVAETKIFSSEKDAKIQFEEWLNE